MGVDGDGPAERVAELGRHQRDARRAPDEQDGVEVLGGHAGLDDGLAQHRDGLVDERPDERLELRPGQRDGRRRRRHPVGDLDLVLHGQRFLGVDAGGALAGQALPAVRRRGHRGGVHAEDAQQLGHQRVVDVDAPEVLDAERPADDGEVAAGVAQQRGVERPAAEVVDGDRGALGHPGLAGIPAGGRLRLGQRRHRRPHVGEAGHAIEQLALVRSPVGRMGEGHVLGRRTLLGLDLVEHRPQQRGHQRLGRERLSAEHERGGVAEAALELARQPGRFDEAGRLGPVADQHRAVGRGEHQRGNGHGPVPERHHRGGAVTAHRGGGERGPEIDADDVAQTFLAADRHVVTAAGSRAKIVAATPSLETHR
jgi:hypothetical protein